MDKSHAAVPKTKLKTLAKSSADIFIIFNFLSVSISTKRATLGFHLIDYILFILCPVFKDMGPAACDKRLKKVKMYALTMSTSINFFVCPIGTSAVGVDFNPKISTLRKYI